jgi:hypothetical protein
VIEMHVTPSMVQGLVGLDLSGSEKSCAGGFSTAFPGSHSLPAPGTLLDLKRAAAVFSVSSISLAGKRKLGGRWDLAVVSAIAVQPLHAGSHHPPLCLDHCNCGDV